MPDALLLRTLDLVDDDFDLDDLLDDVAGAVRLPVRESFYAEDEDPGELALEEAGLGSFMKKWDESKHPRWPKATPRAGQFMRVGQRFELGGVEYEVALPRRGKLYAHVASGKYADTKTVEIKASKGEKGLEIVGAKPATPKAIIGGKHQNSTVTVIDPYVQDDHDPSIPKPDGVAAEQWAKFGKLDQENYLDVHERFGKWKEGAAKSLHDAAYKEYDSTIQKLVKDAYKSQYGSSSGNSLSLASLFQGGSVASAFDLRQKAKELQGDLAAIVQWDLYNRTGSPDITLFHKNTNDHNYWQNGFIDGNSAIFSGLSQSWKFNANWQFGSRTLATPTAIRHVLMSSYSAQPVPGETHFTGEIEVSVPERQKIDGRSMNFTVPSHGGGGYGLHLDSIQEKWLIGSTNKPGGGDVLRELQEAVKGNTILKPPPAPANIVSAGGGAQLWADPPAPAAASTQGWNTPEIKKYAPAELGQMAKSGQIDVEFELLEDDGVTPKLLPANQSGFHAGDFMLGKQGTLYWVGTDPGDSTGFGLRYHKIVGGVFTGESWGFTGGGTSAYYKLKGHFAEPKVKETTGADFYDAGQWTNSKEEFFIGQLKKGDKFKVAGIGYELQNDGDMGKTNVAIKNLENAKLMSVNTDYKTPKLLPIEGYEFQPGGEDVGDQPEAAETGPSLYIHPKDAQAGDFFAHDGKKYVVTGVLKGTGEIKAKPTGGTVEKFDPGDERLQNAIFRPDDWLHSPGNKTMLSMLKPGDLFDIGAGAKLRPAVVLGKSGSKVTWKSLESGEEGANYGYKSVRSIVPKGEVPDDLPKATPVDAKLAAGEGKFDIGQYVDGPALLWKDIPLNGILKMGAQPYMKTGEDEALNLNTNKTIPAGMEGAKSNPDHPITTTKLATLVPKTDAIIAYADLSKGDITPAGTLKPGDVYTVGQDTTTFYMVTGSSDDDGSLKVEMKVINPDNTLGAKGQALPDFPVTLFSKAAVKNKFAVIVVGTYFAKSGDVWQKTSKSKAVLVEKDANQFADLGESASFDMFTTVEFLPEYVPAEAPKVGPAYPLPPEEDTGTYTTADAVGFKPYKSKWGSGGKYKHELIGEMPVGTHFKDAAKQEWIVKQSGQHPIVSNGEQNYAVEPTYRGRVLDKAGLIDSAPPVGTPAADVWAGLKDVPVGLTLGDYQLVPGDQFVTNGILFTFKTMAANGEVYYATNEKSGKTVLLSPGKGILKVSPTALLVGESKADPLAELAPDMGPLVKKTGTVGGQAKQMGLSAMPSGSTLDGLALGDKFAFASNGKVWAVSEITKGPPGQPDLITAKDVPISGNLMTGSWPADTKIEAFKAAELPAGWDANAENDTLETVLLPMGSKVLVGGKQYTLPNGTNGKAPFLADGEDGEIAALKADLQPQGWKLPPKTPAKKPAAGVPLVGDYVALKPGTVAKQGPSELFLVMGKDPQAGKLTLNNNVGGEVVTSWDAVTAVHSYVGVDEFGEKKYAKPTTVAATPLPVGSQQPFSALEVGTHFKSTSGATFVVAVDDEGVKKAKVTTSVAGLKLGKVYATPSTMPTTVIDPPADEIDAYLGDDFWPDGTPLPKIKDKVWVTYVGDHLKGEVDTILTDAEGEKSYLIKLDAEGAKKAGVSKIEVGEYELLRPSSDGPSGELGADPDPELEVMGGFQPNDKVSYAGGAVGTVMGSQGGYITVQTNAQTGEWGAFKASELKPYVEPLPKPGTPEEKELLDKYDEMVASTPKPGTLQPYTSKYGSGGKYKHEEIGDLPPGTEFADKTKAKYTVVAHWGNKTVYKDADGQQFETDRTNRVRKTAEADPSSLLGKTAAPAPAAPASSIPKPALISDLPDGAVYKALAGYADVTVLSHEKDYVKVQVEGKPPVTVPLAAVFPGGGYVVSLPDEDVGPPALAADPDPYEGPDEKKKPPEGDLNKSGTQQLIDLATGDETLGGPSWVSGIDVAFLVGYGSKYGSGGKYKHEEIADVAIGELIRGKDGAKYVHAGPAPDAAGVEWILVMRDSDKTFFKIKATNADGKPVRVRVLED